MPTGQPMNRGGVYDCMSDTDDNGRKIPVEMAHRQYLGQDGQLFYCGVANSALATDGVIDVLIRPTVGKNMHGRITFAGAAAAKVELYGTVTVHTSSYGTTLSAFNMNQGNTSTALVALSSGPTVTVSAANMIGTFFLPGSMVLTFPPDGSDIVLVGGQKYLARLSSLAAATACFSLGMTWFHRVASTDTGTGGSS